MEYALGLARNERLRSLIEEAVEFGALVADAGSVLGKDTLTASVPESRDLQLRVLADGGHSSVTNFHDQLPYNHLQRRLYYRSVFSCLKRGFKA